MGELKADLVELNRLGARLHELSAEAAAIGTGPSSGESTTAVGGMMSSVAEARSISASLIDAALVPAIKERLGETGDVMINTATLYRDTDEATGAAVVAAYTDATGDWQTEAVPS